MIFADRNIEQEVAGAMGDIPSQFMDWSPTGLLALVVLFVLTDKLVWHKRLEEERQRTQKALEQGEAAAQVARKSNEQAAVLISAVERISASMDLSVAMLHSIRRRLDIEEEEG